MAPRAIWKGHLKIAELTCPVALYAAASTSERVTFHTLNRATGHQVRREYIDGETGAPVEKEDQVRGYETGGDGYVILTPEEMAAAVPDSDKTLSVETFVRCAEIDTSYFDRPYFLAPSGADAGAFALIREGMRAKQTAALARAVLFRRVRTVLIRAQGPGLVANTLNFDYEVRPAAEVFDKIPEPKVESEMLDLAKHIIKTRSGVFDPARFDDRYDAALAELVKAKVEGRAIKAPEPREEARVVDLMEALRQSARGKTGAGRKAKAAPKPEKDAPGRRSGTRAPSRRKAG